MGEFERDYKAELEETEFELGGADDLAEQSLPKEYDDEHHESTAPAVEEHEPDYDAGRKAKAKKAKGTKASAERKGKPAKKKTKKAKVKKKTKAKRAAKRKTARAKPKKKSKKKTKAKRGKKR